MSIGASNMENRRKEMDQQIQNYIEEIQITYPIMANGIKSPSKHSVVPQIFFLRM